MQIESRRAVITICLELSTIFLVDKEYFSLKGQRENGKKKDFFNDSHLTKHCHY